MFWVQILIACGENDDDSAKAAWKFILSNSSSLYFSSMHPNNTGIYIYENLILWITLRGVPIGISQSHILLDWGRPNTGL